MNQAPHLYITTPIYYANAELHAGHFYTTIIANVMQAHYKCRGYSVKVLTGADEHGEKIAEAAKAKGKDPKEFVDDIALRFKEQLHEFGLTYDIFQRTTDPLHQQNVKEILQHCYDNGDIYYGEHTGQYCVGCEAFLTSSQMDSNKCCLDHKRPTETRAEKNYFFRTTKYLPKVMELLKAGKITSNQRYINELLGVCEQLEGDLSISRPKTRTTWGIELPFDKEHVTYVWFDALPNYLTGIGGLEAAKTSPYWKNCIHLVGKDIIRFHAIYWPAMLMSLNLPIPSLGINGFLLSDGMKMSKSLGNAASLGMYGKEAFTNVALRLVNPGDDIEISIKTLVERYNADLANGIGNLLSRTLGMIEKYCERTIPKMNRDILSETEQAMIEMAKKLPDEVAADFDQFRIADALNRIWILLGNTDKYITSQKPWALSKDTSPAGVAKLETVLAMCVGTLRVCGWLAYPWFPEKMRELLQAIGEDTTQYADLFDGRLNDFFAIKSGHQFQTIPRLFDRIELALPEEINKEPAPQKKPVTPPAIQAANTPPLPEGMISIDQFLKVQVRVATVIQAELVEGSTKLLRLQLSLGELGQRQVFAGIREWMKPEEIVNRKVLMVANLAPRKMKFGISEGMVLAAQTTGGTIQPIFVEEILQEGALLS